MLNPHCSLHKRADRRWSGCGRFVWTLGCGLLLLLGACGEDNPSAPEAPPSAMEDLDIPAGFDYATRQQVDMEISVFDLGDAPVPGVRVCVFDRPFDEVRPDDAFLKGATDRSGTFAVRFPAPLYLNRVFAWVDMVGFTNRAEISLAGGGATHRFGGRIEGASFRGIRSGRLGTDLRHFPDPTVTDLNMSIIILRLIGVAVPPGAEVACVTPDGLVAGAAYLEGEPAWGLAVWGDDASTEEVDGFRDRQPLRFLYWDPQIDREIDAEPTLLQGDELVYITNGLLVIDLLVEPPEGYRYLGTWDDAGVPRYLTRPRDLFRGSFLHRVALDLPEGVGVPQSHPEYLSNDAPGGLTTVDSVEVFVGFLHENTDRCDALGFYTYPSGQPPQSPDELEVLTVIFPNASAAGSGGGLIAGDRVFIGTFAPRTTVGWFLVMDGWRDRSVGEGRGRRSAMASSLSR